MNIIHPPKPVTKISIEHYLVTNNPEAVQKVLMKYGIPQMVDVKDGIHKVRFVMQKRGASAIKDLADVTTPYREFVISHVAPTLPAKTEKSSNACGCSGADGNTSSCDGNCSCKKKSSADASTTTETKPSTITKVEEQVQVQSVASKAEEGISKHFPVIALGLLLVIGTVVIVKK